MGAAAGAALGWGWFEAGWVRFRRLELAIAGMPGEVRIVHLSDFHLGIPSRGRHAVERAIEWTLERQPDLVCITGDLVSRPGGAAVLRDLIEPLGPNTYVVLGNHDVAFSRDPFSRAAGLTELAPAHMLVDDAVSVAVGDTRVQLVGVDPRSYRSRTSEPWKVADPGADLRVLLCHFPLVVDRLPQDVFQLVLAGHMHDGQISFPLPRDKFRFAHPRARYAVGLYTRGGTTMHVSPGLGTTFVPFRFYARPEATELVLQPSR